MKRKILSVALSLLFIFSLAASNSFAENSNITTNQKSIEVKPGLINNNYFDILEKKGVDPKDLSKLQATSLESLVRQANAYNFTNEQVQLYVKGLLSELDPAFVKKMGGQNGIVREDGLIQTSDGIVPNRYANKTINDLNVDSNSISLKSYSGNYRSVTNSGDQTGTYWLVKSETGYKEATAFATLPTINSLASNDVAYMFFSANTSPSSIVGDYGVYYTASNGTWKPCTSTGVWNGSSYNMTWWNGASIPSTITQIYLDMQVTSTSTNDTVKLRVLNANDFSQVLGTNTVTFYNNPINSSYSNLNLYREITMAQNNSGILNTNTGSWFTNAAFSNSYIYSSGGYWQWGTTHTNDAYIQAPTTSKLATISVNSYSKWYAENISMHYNIP